MSMGCIYFIKIDLINTTPFYNNIFDCFFLYEFWHIRYSFMLYSKESTIRKKIRLLIPIELRSNLNPLIKVNNVNLLKMFGKILIVKRLFF